MTNNKREFRFSSAAPQIRGKQSKPKIVGYASVFNSVTDLGAFREVIRPGAFARSIRERADVRGLVEHDPARIIGRTKAGTLRLSEDGHGLVAEIDPPDTELGRALVASIQRGDLDGMSFGFVPRQQRKSADGIREILDANLFDVSVVAFPAYPATSVEARSLLFPDGLPELPAPTNRTITSEVDPEEVERLRLRLGLRRIGL